MSKYLIDTNILIYHTAGFSQIKTFIEQTVSESPLNISVVTKIEFLGWDKHTEEGFAKCKKLMDIAHVIPLDEAIAENAINLKKKSSIKLGDAIIAATAITNGLILVTRNKDDFKDVNGLELFDPFS
jgi:toxin FitB